LNFFKQKKCIHALYIPEIPIDIDAEAIRLENIMDKYDCVNIFLSEGAGVKDIVKKMEANGEEVPRDAFGHVKLDKVNPGAYFAKQFAEKVRADKVLVQKSGYMARSAAANAADRALIERCCQLAVQCGLQNNPGCIGEDEDQNDTLRAIEFPRIKGHKPFNIEQTWFKDLQTQIYSIQ